MATDFKFNSNGTYTVERDGVFRDPDLKAAKSPTFQLRKGHVVPEESAKRLKRIGPWPGEVDPEDEEAIAVASAKKAVAPENKKNPDPENK